MPRARGRTVFVCQTCGDESLKWAGQCPQCGEWNTLAESSTSESSRQSRASWLNGDSVQPQELSEITSEAFPRRKLASRELNRVLGGGLVAGSLALIAGEPGIGKSTLLLRLADEASTAFGKTLYVSGEESLSQIKMRADRLGVTGRNLFLLPETNIDAVINYFDAHKPALAMIDSIQTIYDESMPSEAGSVSQIRECGRKLMSWAKSNNTPIVLTGHVTKSGDIAGPRILEHMVDVSLFMEGDPVSSWRLLRAVKNRFGSTNEIGVFEMTGRGLLDVDDPSRTFLSERRDGVSGSVVIATIEGSRPLLVEVQALVSPSVLPAPRRVATGIDFNRLLLVCAVLARRVGASLSSQDIVVNVTGGLRLSEPAADLGLALAIISSLRNAPVKSGIVAIGEIGLTGEIRRVPQLERRVREAERLGLKKCLVPRFSSENLSGDGGKLHVLRIDSLSEAIRACIPAKAKSNRPSGDLLMETSN